MSRKPAEDALQFGRILQVRPPCQWIEGEDKPQVFVAGVAHLMSRSRRNEYREARTDHHLIALHAKDALTRLDV